MRFFLVLFLTVIVAFITVQGYRLFVQQAQYAQEAELLQQQAERISAENAALMNDVEFYQNPTNAAKELQSKINYKKPDEQLIILVPEE